MKPHQFELNGSAQVFNLAGEVGEDPVRLALEAGRKAAAAETAREYERTMQRTLEQCPGFIGADAPKSASCVGKVVVEPAKVSEALAWLKRRFVVAENLELSTDNGLCVEVAPRAPRKAGVRRPRFGKVEQFKLDL